MVFAVSADTAKVLSFIRVFVIFAFYLGFKVGFYYGTADIRRSLPRTVTERQNSRLAMQ